MNVPSRFLTLFVFAVCAVTATLRASPILPDKVYIHLVQMEGCKLLPYRDGNQWVVGIGHVLKNPEYRIYHTEEIYAWFDADLANARRICRKGIRDFDKLPHDAQLAAISLAWTVGPTGFMRFKNFRRELSKQNYRRAADELMKSKWWSQVSRERAEETYNLVRALDW